MNLIVQASLTEPPTESLYLRYLTMVAHQNLKLDCLLEAEQEMKDLYYRYLLKQGLMDFFEEIVTPQENLNGLRLGSEISRSPAIKLKAVRCDNCVYLLGMIKGSIIFHQY